MLGRFLQHVDVQLAPKLKKKMCFRRIHLCRNSPSGHLIKCKQAHLLTGYLHKCVNASDQRMLAHLRLLHTSAACMKTFEPNMLIKLSMDPNAHISIRKILDILTHLIATKNVPEATIHAALILSGRTEGLKGAKKVVSLLRTHGFEFNSSVLVILGRICSISFIFLCLLLFRGER